MQPVANTRTRILVADDTVTNRDTIGRVFDTRHYEVIDAEKGDQVLELLSTQPFDVVLLDIMMPGMDGFEICRRIRQQPDLVFLPVIMVTALNEPDSIARGMDAGATDYIVKPFDSVELRARVKAAIERKRLTDQLDHTEEVVFSITRMIEAREASAPNHCDQLMGLCHQFGVHLGLSAQQLSTLARGCMLHDIGMLTVPESILQKKDKLTRKDWQKIKMHTVAGCELCSPLRTMRDTVDIIVSHHERWDGSGYPDGLKGENIPVLARIFQIVDIYDALRSERSYRPALHRKKALEIMRKETDRGWRDPALMKEFIQLLRSKPGLIEESGPVLAGIW